MLRKISYLVIFFLFLLISWRVFQSHIFNIHFVDEDENIVAGYYMTKGEKLYSDIFSHKQPLPAVLSMATQRITNPPNLYMLIKRHREVIFFYSAVWTMILIWAFGFPALIFGVSFEITKQFLLGNLFLGESLVIFPAVYTIGFLWKYHKNFDKPERLERFLFCFSLILLILFLFAIIPLAILLGLIPLKKWRKYLPYVGLVIGIGLLLTFPFVSYQKYFENTLAAIQTQYWGSTVNEGFGKIMSYSFFRPLASFIIGRKGDFGNFVAGLSLVYLISLFFLLLFKKHLRKILLISFLLLGISSFRYIEPSATFYNGFHALPWLGLILWVTIWQLEEIWQDRRLRRVGVIMGIVYLIYLGRFFVNDYYRATDRETDWYVHFSQLRDNGQTIKRLAKPGDKLLVMPIEQLIYWESGLGHATRFLYGYEWLFANNQYKQELISELKKDQPAFIYYDRESMGKDAHSILDGYVAGYTRFRQNGQETSLFIKKDRFKNNNEKTF